MPMCRAGMKLTGGFGVNGGPCVESAPGHHGVRLDELTREITSRAKLFRDWKPQEWHEGGRDRFAEVWSQSSCGRGWLDKEAATTTLLHSHPVIASLQHGAHSARMHEDPLRLLVVMSVDVTILKG